MASFHAKIGWKRWERAKIKSIISFRPYPACNRKLQKNSEKIEKIKKNTVMALFQSKIVGNHETERKWKLSFRLVLTRHIIENSKKIWKKFKKFKNTLMASFETNIGWERLRKRANKKFRFVSSVPVA